MIKNIKFLMILLIIMFSLCINIYSDQPINIPLIYNITLPNNVTYFINRFGKPNKIIVPTEIDLQLCPEGQWFQWSLNEGSFILSILSNEYSIKPNIYATVRFVELTTTNNTTRKTIYDFVFNKTQRQDIEKIFKSNIELTKGKFNIFRRNVLKLRDNKEHFTYFYFSVNGILIGVAQSIFEIDMAG
jgi:hypothetical protein